MEFRTAVYETRISIAIGSGVSGVLAGLQSCQPSTRLAAVFSSFFLIVLFINNFIV